MRAITASALLAGAVLLVVGCDKQGILSLRHRAGEEVVFGINARPETRTVYGTDKEVDGKTIQAIDWIATDGDTQGDLIRIYSPEAVRENVSGGIEHWADYEIAEYVDGDHSVAKIRNVHTNGLAWGTADSYTFYALYPAPSDEDHHSPASELAGKLTPENGIPNQQVFSEKGNMQYAYMTAVAKDGAGIEGDQVNLDFYPDFTAFEIKVKSAGDPIGLSKFELISGNKPMAGTYTIDYSSGTKTYTFDSSDQNIISVNMDHSAGADYLTFTVLALPKEYDQLSVRFTTSQGVTRSLALKYSDTATDHTPGSYVKFAPGKKHRIYGLALPNGELLVSVGTAPWEEGDDYTYTTIEDASILFDYQKTRLFLNGLPLWNDTRIAIAPGYETVHVDPEDPASETTNRPMYSPMFTLTTVSVGVELALVSDNPAVGFVRMENGVFSEPAASLTIPASVVTAEKPYGTENVTTYFVVPLSTATAGDKAGISLVRTDCGAAVAYTHQDLPGSTDHTKILYQVVTPANYTGNTISVEETL